MHILKGFFNMDNLIYNIIGLGLVLVFLIELKKVRVYKIINLFFKVIMYTLLISASITIINIIGG